jgi:hypothetical protein
MLYPRPALRTAHQRPGVAVLLILAILLAACSAGPSSATAPEPSSPTEVAQLYIAALLDGDETRAHEWIVPDPWCTTPGLEADFQQQIATLQGAQARNFHIQEEDVTGWLAYPPGTKAASVSFEFRLNEMEWRAAEIFVAIINGGICDTRFSTD